MGFDVVLVLFEHFFEDVCRRLVERHKFDPEAAHSVAVAHVQVKLRHETCGEQGLHLAQQIGFDFLCVHRQLALLSLKNQADNGTLACIVLFDCIKIYLALGPWHLVV